MPNESIWSRFKNPPIHLRRLSIWGSIAGAAAWLALVTLRYFDFGAVTAWLIFTIVYGVIFYFGVTVPQLRDHDRGNR